jgi:glycosyltransferase involved in cell wall biosynthesis
MTVCIATDGFPPQVGGIATFNQHLSGLLTNAGHNVIVLYIGYEAQHNEEDDVIREGCLTRVILKKTYSTILETWKPYFRPGGFDAPNWIAIGLSMREWLFKNHQEYKIDIIEASDYGGCGIFLTDPKLPPVIITGHGSLLQYSRYNYTNKDDHFKVVRKLEELSFTHADAVIAHSPLNQHDLQALFDREILFAHIPWSPPVALSEKPATKDQLLVVGGLQPVKGIYQMAEAMELLYGKRSGITLTWIGGDTFLAPGQKKMSAYLEKKYPGIWQKSFCWQNSQSYTMTQQQIAGAKLVVIPSHFETFNYVALEAAYYKKPILVTSGAGVSYLFKHGHDAWITLPGDPGALVEAILYLSENPAVAAKLGEQAHETLLKEFAPENILQERISIYEGIIQNRDNTVNKLTAGYSFIYKYKNSGRKYYYYVRQWIKKLVTGKVAA